MEQLVDEIKQQLAHLQGVEDEESLELAREFRDRLAARQLALKQTRSEDELLGNPAPAVSTSPWPLEPEEYDRYSRQMIVPGVGLQGQLNIRSARVLVIGAGGLGCPAATYLAGAGIGTVGIIDGDTVEVSNLHRQIGHSTARVGMNKADSLITYLKGLNPLVRYRAHKENLRPDNAREVVAQYDVVLDCTDRPAGRYLISDICVLLQKPLVSAAALRTDGQMIVLNCPPVPPGSKYGAPCYRCVWRDPPRPELSMTCGEFGVLGPAVGVMGVLQANEAIKLIAAGRHHPSPAPEQASDPALLVFADWKSFGMDRSAIRSVGMKRKLACVACSPARTITLEGIAAGTPDYDDFCGLNSLHDTSLPPSARIAPAKYQAMAGALPTSSENSGKHHILLDVREPEHFSVSSLPGAVNVRYRDVCRWLARYDPSSPPVASPASGPAAEAQMPWEDDGHAGKDIWVVCRTGKDSQDVVAKMLAKGMDRNGEVRIGDIAGGMKAWKEQVDHSLPFV
ncbi:hypothetical protein GQ53DRAFT_137733 [Thozetella sp. PMI_491]|nr:hypothetical protein GQ53DRAFT_137733 [Thozetella sp. PMI_491]